VYHFDRHKLLQAHKHCQRRVQDAVRNKDINSICVANTNLRWQDMKEYIMMVLRDEDGDLFSIHFVFMSIPPIEELVRRNLHGVDKEVMSGMISRAMQMRSGKKSPQLNAEYGCKMLYENARKEVRRAEIGKVSVKESKEGGDGEFTKLEEAMKDMKL
jgi:hypothetical protein